MDDRATELRALQHVFCDASAEPIKLSFGFLKSITHEFQYKIGHGRSGSVYMGFLRAASGSGGRRRRRTKVAVKELSNLHVLPDDKFLECLKKANHKNIVRLLGYCTVTQQELLQFYRVNKGHKMLLCFEYVPNGNILHYLEEENHEDDWPARYQMIRGTCDGLHYLHDKRISHLDLKPENVMLDAQMEPKITDFCLSRLVDQGQSEMSTHHIPGKLQSLGPDIVFEEQRSFKSDTYALGIIIIKLLTGNSMSSLENWDGFIDVDCPRARMCAAIALRCTDAEEYNRPTLHEIICELNKVESMVSQFPINQLLHPVGTSFAVLVAYALLLMISTNYIQIAAIPAIILVFIGVLWGNFWVKGRLQHRNNNGTAANQGSGSGQAWRMLLPTVLLSYCLQLIQLACAQVTNGQQSDNFLFSHSLLFLSSALGALAVMIAALPIRANQCVAQGQQLIHRIFIVVFMIAVHMMATEWMMVEVMPLVCMPEFIASLVWLTTGNFDHARCMVLIDKVTSRRSTVTFLTAAVALLAFMFAFENEMVLASYWYRGIMYSCTLSGLLSCLCVWMILQWRPDISANVPLDWPSGSAIISIRILEFSALICFAMSAVLLFIGFLLNYSIL